MAAAPINPEQPTNPPAQTSTGNSPRTYSQADLDEIVARTRRDEKDKLYADLKSKDDRIAAIQTELASTKTTAERAIQLEKDLETVRAQTSTISTNLEKTLNEALTKQATEFEDRLKQTQLEGYRDRLLAGVSDPDALDFITDLVLQPTHKNTQEEIKASFDKAMAKYQKVVDAASARKETELQEKYKGNLPKAVTPGSTPDGTTPNANGTERGASTGLKDWLKMSPKDRETKIAELKSKAFAESGLPLGTGG